MIRSLLSFVAAAVTLLAPALALAEREPETIDPRMENLPKTVLLEKAASPAMAWLLLVFLTLIALFVMFKNAKRTHLD